jgi:hypothetical protein
LGRADPPSIERTQVRGLNAEQFRESVPRADAVDAQRAVIVAGERPAGHEVHDESLQARDEIRQDPMIRRFGRSRRDQSDDLAQRINLRPAEFIGLPAARRRHAGSAASASITSSTNTGWKRASGLASGNASGTRRQQRRETVQERIARDRTSPTAGRSSSRGRAVGRE